MYVALQSITAGQVLLEEMFVQMGWYVMTPQVAVRDNYSSVVVAVAVLTVSDVVGDHDLVLFVVGVGVAPAAATCLHLCARM